MRHGICIGVRDMATYRTVVYMDSSDADEVQAIIKKAEWSRRGAAWVLRYLQQWDTNEGDISDSAPWGGNDDFERFPCSRSGRLDRRSNSAEWVVSWNDHLDYISLTFVNWSE
jgi:hypothetical protein